MRRIHSYISRSTKMAGTKMAGTKMVGTKMAGTKMASTKLSTQLVDTVSKLPACCASANSS